MRSAMVTLSRLAMTFRWTARMASMIAQTERRGQWHISAPVSLNGRQTGKRLLLRRSTHPLQYPPRFAGVAQWQCSSFPSWPRGFDSPHPLFERGSAEGLLDLRQKTQDRGRRPKTEPRQRFAIGGSIRMIRLRVFALGVVALGVVRRRMIRWMIRLGMVIRLRVVVVFAAPLARSPLHFHGILLSGSLHQSDRFAPASTDAFRAKENSTLTATGLPPTSRTG